MPGRFIALCAALVLSFGLSTPAAQAAECGNLSAGNLLGTLGGAALGGLLGAQIGKGRGRLMATGAGVLAGALVGNQVAKSLTCRDQNKASTTTQRTLETQKAGTTIAWNNPDSGNSGTITPQSTYQRADGAFCREFQQTITVGGKTEDGYGTACRQPDGSWKFVQ